MADNLTALANTGSGTDVLATDEIAGVHYPRSKTGFGVDGAYADVSAANPLPVLASNITTKFREAFEAYTPGARWTESVASGDIISLEGNAAAASYLTISKSPLLDGTTTITSVPVFDMPFEAAVGLHMSQRTLGQEFSIELVSNETPLSTPDDLAISAIQQAASVLTVTTTLPHNLKPGMRIGIRDCADSRFNYQALVVASIPTTTQFTATAGPGGTIPSITAGPFATGFVFQRSALGFAPNGTSMIFENATATNASFYVRAESGDALPSGTILGNHAVTTLSTASVQAINAAFTYAFQPTNEFRLSQFIDGVQWSDAVIDTVAASNNRYKRTQVVPDIAHDYRIRIRCTNNASFSRPVAQIVTAVKSGTTTATITTDVAHGLTTADLIVVYGIRDQAATAFPNLLTATAVASIVNATQFTVVIGTAATVTSFGGYVARVNGGTLMSAMGATSVVAQAIARTSNVLTVTGNATWTGFVIGDMVNLVGCRDNATGATLGVDGAYRVANIVTTALTLEPINLTVSPNGGDIGSTNCGGGIIKRTCMRLSYIRILDFERQRVEMFPRPQGDISAAASVNVQNVPAVTVNSGTITTVSALTGGGVAEDAAAGANPVITGGVVRTAIAPATLVAGDAARHTMTSGAAQIVHLYSIPELSWQTPAPVGGILNTTTSFQLMPAAGAGIRNYTTAIDFTSDALTNATDLRIREADITCNSQTIASNTLTTSAVHDLAIGDAVVFSASTVTGITTGVTYYVLTTPATTTITLSASRGGTTLAISGTGVTATFHKVLWQTRIPTTGVAPRQVDFQTPLRGSLNRALLVQTATASGAGAVHLSAQGYVAP
jgi:hypothetical protein